MTDEEKIKFETALGTRNFEIELFWKRTIFFWGFIAAAFVGFASLHERHPGYALIIANFGMVCSLAWTLANKGSTFWQQKWEKEVTDHQSPVVGNMFDNPEKERPSVSKLVKALSFYTFLLWVGIVGFETIRQIFFSEADCFAKFGKSFCTLFSIAYLFYLRFRCKASI